AAHASGPALAPIPLLEPLRRPRDTPPEWLPSPRCETPRSSGCPTAAGSRTGDPAPRTPRPASPQTFCATGSAPVAAGTSTAARSDSGSASTSATAPARTPDAAAATPSPPAKRNTWHGPGTTQSDPSPDAQSVASAAG